MTAPLPGRPGVKLAAIWEAMTTVERQLFKPVLLGSASAEWLADLLRSEGHEVSASTIRTYRRALRREGVASV
ncbi:hypothetical protein SEA_MANEEKUL_42 [Streptomyces phage Maneekul]|uniref:Helix-turn-helix DNA binding domain protein n=1 Tax=Streptomyces phage Yasdnil TaxID=2593360 RepID=A0A514U489_9CAUD|nr:hypothetical protein KGG98_gp42 [Streptomyces phage Yasdnil]AWN07410.1 hypothetical protein SEA_MANEEKUL_42 [Streptomyces phage Maneekul]QDK03212.1 hypothetical protein SEA_TUANPN_41 [Streptomyces phage TuanPN]QDK03766.1 hypothetical protein SEA_YASDNIL_42 [Streptomyces phage Yasdnil]USH46051.1 hypothetical protein SEA_EJEMPLO_41 [Streptomyces phage Ejemplo]